MNVTTTTAIPPAHKIRRLYLKGASVEVPHMDRMSHTPVQPVIGSKAVIRGRECEHLACKQIRLLDKQQQRCAGCPPAQNHAERLALLQ